MPRKKRSYKGSTKRRRRQVERKCPVPPQYASLNGFLTASWGPAVWHVLLIIALNYPLHPTKEQKENAYQFVKYLLTQLPCGACRKNAKKNVKKVKFTKTHSLKNRDTFSRWVYALHDEVNRMLGKKTPMSFEEYRHMYEMMRAKSCHTSEESKGIESGCVQSQHTIKSKCLLRIVPDYVQEQTFSVDPRCGWSFAGG